MNDGYEELVAAIVMQTYRDRCDDFKMLASEKGNIYEIKKNMIDILKFVKLGWRTQLRDIPAKKMIQRLNT